MKAEGATRDENAVSGVSSSQDGVGSVLESPGRAAPLVGVLFHNRKVTVRFPVRVLTGGNQSMFLLLSPSLPSPLSEGSEHVLR